MTKSERKKAHELAEELYATILTLHYALVSIPYNESVKNKLVDVLTGIIYEIMNKGANKI